MRASGQHYNQPSSYRDGSDHFVRALFVDLDRRRADARGQIDWAVEPRSADERTLLEEVNRRRELLRGANKMSLELSPRMQALVADFGHTLPVYRASAAWVRDPSAEQFEPAKLFVSVMLHDPDFPNSYSMLSFSSNLPLGSDLHDLGPVDFDPVVILAEELGPNRESAFLYEITPYSAEQGV